MKIGKKDGCYDQESLFLFLTFPNKYKLDSVFPMPDINLPVYDHGRE